MSGLFGFDFGKKRIGTATGNTITGSATPLKTIANGDWAMLEKLLKEWRPKTLVVGRPANMDGTPHKMTEAAEHFAQALRDRFGLVVEMMDERQTSLEAEARFKALRQSGQAKQSDKEIIDSISAQIILERWLAIHA